MKLTNDEKIAQAKLYLGTKHVLHKAYDGKHTVRPDAETDIGRTFDRLAKAKLKAEKAAADDQSRILNVRQINRRSA